MSMESPFIKKGSEDTFGEKMKQLQNELTVLSKKREEVRARREEEEKRINDENLGLMRESGHAYGQSSDFDGKQRIDRHFTEEQKRLSAEYRKVSEVAMGEEKAIELRMGEIQGELEKLQGQPAKTFKEAA